jgi:hydrogenase maturation factor
MKSRLIAVAVTLGVLLVTGSTSAHHSTAMYDGQNPVTITGAVKKFEWTNPHAFVYLEVKDAQGKIVEWEVEMMSLNHLRAYGWTSRTVKPGDVISATGAPARSGAPSMIANRMKLPGGRDIRS